VSALSYNNICTFTFNNSAYSDVWFDSVKFNFIIVCDLNCPNINRNTLKAKEDSVQDELLNCTVSRGFPRLYGLLDQELRN